MKCPRCEVPLNEITKTGVLVDVCDKCRGMWLDRGELEKISSRLHELEREWDDDDGYEREKHWSSRGRDSEDYRPRRKKSWRDMFEIFD